VLGRYFLVDFHGSMERARERRNVVLQAMVEAGDPGMFAKPLEVDVSANAWVDVTVSVDTGIR